MKTTVKVGDEVRHYDDDDFSSEDFSFQDLLNEITVCGSVAKEDTIEYTVQGPNRTLLIQPYSEFRPSLEIKWQVSVENHEWFPDPDIYRFLLLKGFIND